MTDPVRPLPPGFDFVRSLGAGAYGDVVLARQRSLGRLVAVKRIHAFALSDEGAVDRFRREGQVLGRVRTPSIVRVFDFVTDADGGLLVMEFVDGPSFAEVLARPSSGVAERLTVLGDVADALAGAADAGIVHRDVKPGNVLVQHDGRAKLGDFGLARVRADPAVFRTMGAGVAGTPAYFAPELVGGAEPDARSDAYSFAVMAFEAVTGHRPFEGADPLATVYAHARQPAPRADEILPGVPTRSADALEAGLAKNPDDRPSPQHLMRALLSTSAGRYPPPWHERPDRDAPTFAVAHPTRPPAAVAPRLTDPRPPARRRRWPLVAAAATAAALVAGALTVAFIRGDGTPATLSVQSVSVTTTPPLGRCPSQRFVVRTVVTTNGAAGRLTVRWLLPDGRTRAPRTITVSAGESSVEVRVGVVITGERPLRGPVSVTASASGHDVRGSGGDLAYAC